MKTLFAGIALGVALLVGCAATAPIDPAIRTQFYVWKACGAYNKALDTVTLLQNAGKLSQGQRDAVVAVVKIVSPTCESPDTLGISADAINDQIDRVLEAIIISRSAK